MAQDLVIDIGNSRIKLGFFVEDRLDFTCAAAIKSFSQENFGAVLKGRTIGRVLISSVNHSAEQLVLQALTAHQLPYSVLDFSTVKMALDVDEPEAVGHDRIANAYGALKIFPTFDCIIIDIGTAVTADFVAKEGRYTGGMIYPGPALSAKVLADYTDKLPLVSILKPDSPLGKTTETHIQSGIYYGLLGAIERLIAELRMTAPSPSSVKVLATGGATAIEDTGMCEGKVAFVEDLKELVDFINPHLTLVGLHEIQKEHISP
ncbi:MAG: type III pantothenate kinase [Parachlamydiales bacterium]